MDDEQLKKRIYHAEILLKQIKALAVVEDNLDNDALVNMIDAYLNNTKLRCSGKHAPLSKRNSDEDVKIKCPVCGDVKDVTVLYCEKCGWHRVDVLSEPKPSEQSEELYQCPDGCGKTVIILGDGSAKCQICKEKFEPFDKVTEPEPLERILEVRRSEPKQ